MVKWINSWAQGIIIAVIISTIIEMILPDGNIKKYIRTVIGTYIVFVIVSPIVSKITGKEISLKAFELPQTNEYEVATIDTNAYIENTYINNIKKEIISNIEEKGYSVEKIEIEIEQNEENYGNINIINLQLEKDNQNSSIEPIEVKIEEETKQTIPKQEIESLKIYLNENYGTEIENIKIN